MHEFVSWLAHAVGWLTACLAALTIGDWGIIIGMASSLGTFLVNLYYARKRAGYVRQG